jgi:hypothetical protein
MIQKRELYVKNGDNIIPSPISLLQVKNEYINKGDMFDDFALVGL